MPTTDNTLHNVTEAAQRWRTAETDTWKAAAAARTHHSDETICRAAGISRATLHRRLGPRSVSLDTTAGVGSS